MIFESENIIDFQVDETRVAVVGNARNVYSGNSAFNRFVEQIIATVKKFHKTKSLL